MSLFFHQYHCVCEWMLFQNMQLIGPFQHSPSSSFIHSVVLCRRCYTCRNCGQWGLLRSKTHMNNISTEEEKCRGCGQKKKKGVVAEYRKWKQSSRFQRSCYCSLFWLLEDLIEPWPLCLQHEEVVRQAHNKTWCSWVFLCFWHCTSHQNHSAVPHKLALGPPVRLCSAPKSHLLLLKEQVTSFCVWAPLSHEENGPQSH